MIRFIIKRHMDNGRTVGTSTFETFDVDVPELEAALTGGGHDHAGSYDVRELVGVEVLPAESDLCQNCGDLAHPGCNSEFSAEPACRFWGPGAASRT